MIGTIASTLVLGLQLTAAASNPAPIYVQNSVPRLDTARTCQAEANTGIAVGGQDYKTCMQTEEANRTELSKKWNSFAVSDRATCTGLSSAGGQSTYTELVTCLEMLRDARKLSKENREGLNVNSTVGAGQR